MPLFDSDQVDGFLFFVMPYIDGETLREKQLPVEEAVGIATAVAAALSVGWAEALGRRLPIKIGRS